MANQSVPSYFGIKHLGGREDDAVTARGTDLPRDGGFGGIEVLGRQRNQNAGQSWLLPLRLTLARILSSARRCGNNIRNSVDRVETVSPPSPRTHSHATSEAGQVKVMNSPGEKSTSITFY
jgi:hypothetical protein